ncbi:hypothetical protein UPYG_G00164860, partial [Umbra pygmaea]
ILAVLTRFWAGKPGWHLATLLGTSAAPPHEVNMAAKENMDPNEYGEPDPESVVNRWIVDFYIHMALETFRNEQYTDFCEIRDILQTHLVRPLEANDAITKKIRAIQFLSRINDGDKLDFFFESQEPLTPLESAMSVLENISEEITVPEKDLERVRQSIREMLVIVCIKNKEFDKAKDVLMNYFPKGTVGKKAVFLGLVTNRSIEHPALELVTYQQFKQEMLHFCQGLFNYPPPFLCRAARQLLAKRQKAGLEDGGDSSHHPEDDSVSATPRAGQQGNNLTLRPSAPPCGVQLTCNQLKAVYTALAEELGESRTFSQLEKEVEREVEQENTRGRTVDPENLVVYGSPRQGSDAVLEQEVPGCQRDSESPMEASPADPVPPLGLAHEAESQVGIAQAPAGPQWRRRDWPCTISRLVIEPDSQDSTTPLEPRPVAQIEEQTESGRKEPVAEREESVAEMGVPVDKGKHLATEEDPLSSDSDTPPTWKYRKRRACKTMAQSTTYQRSPTPQKASTSQKETDPKWKNRFKSAKESKERWSDEEDLFHTHKEGSGESTITTEGSRKRIWTAEETEWLMQGVKRYGEGKWAKIKSSYPFVSRTSVNIKDRWRTLKKLKMV